MAKSPTVKTDGVDKDLLKQIVAGTVNFVSQTQGQPMLAHVPALIEINPAMTDPADPTKVACRATADAAAYLAEPATGHSAEAPKYEILSGVELPAAKRRGNHTGSGAPTKYPFDSLPVGGVFFSGNSEHKKNDAVKALGSTVSAQNNKYSEPVMGADGKPETKTVTRAVRDKKTHKAVLNADGSKQTETVQLPVKNYTRKFTIRPVEKGFVSGGWTAPEDGALIGRVK
jgi:hypothetical protein